jgi:CubicO group peptidase (beta-lactamase class C family)
LSSDGEQKILFFQALYLLLALFAASAAGNRNAPQMDDARKIDALFSSVTSPDAPGLAVLVRKDGRALWLQGYGLAELRTKTRISSATNFRLASFTKQFTAMAIMLLVHDQRLRYDQTLTEIFPEFPTYGRQITVRELLNHTAGLPDYEELMEAAEKGRAPFWTPGHQIHDKQVLQLLEKEAIAKFAPGTRWSYSNSAYVVLGLIVARASGMPYGDFLRQRIFKPLRMDFTIVYEKRKNEINHRAYGHTRDATLFRETDQSSTSATLGDGGIYSNLEDLAKWDDALRNHTLLNQQEMQPALTPATLADGTPARWPNEPNEDNLHPGKPVSYGFGWFLDPYEHNGTHPRMWHTGTTQGFRTVIQHFSNENLTIIILSNRTDLDPAALSQQIADIVLGD